MCIRILRKMKNSFHNNSAEKDACNKHIIDSANIIKENEKEADRKRDEDVFIFWDMMDDD